MNTILCADPINSTTFPLNTDTCAKGRPIHILWESDHRPEDEFGTQIFNQGTTQNVYRYTGQQSDADSSLYYLRARYYEPSTGRFITKDPKKGNIEIPQSLNLYVYCNNNPLKSIDPSGEGSFLIFYTNDDRVDFKGAAYARKKKLESCDWTYKCYNYNSQEDQIYVIPISKESKLEEALKKYKDIKEIVFYLHSTPNGLVFKQPADKDDENFLSTKEVKALTTDNVERAAHILVFGCDAYGNGKGSIVDALAQHFGVIAGGYMNGVSVWYVKDKNGECKTTIGHKTGCWYGWGPGYFRFIGPEKKD